MTFRRRRIPPWANVAGWTWLGCVLGFILYGAISAHLDFVETIGYFATNLVVIVYATLGGGILLYGVVVLLDFVRGRKPPKLEKEEDYSSDEANLVP